MEGEMEVWETMLCLGLHGSGLSGPSEKKVETDTPEAGVISGPGTGPSHGAQMELEVQSWDG